MTTLARENPFASERIEALRYVPLHWTWEEMMFPFFGVVVDQNVDPGKILAPGRPVPTGA